MRSSEEGRFCCTPMKKIIDIAGRGQMWMDGLRLEEVSENTPTTNLEYIHDLLDEPVNLPFEE
ncbi:hypothetical protein D3C75_409330 [compost metagenome]